MEKTKENLNPEEKRLLEKIKAIKESEEIEGFIDKMIMYAENYGIPEFSFRIKGEESALNKFREKGYTDADRMGDLLGMMFITESTSQIYEVVEHMRKILPHDKEKEEDDFIKNPKSGYRSFHINSKKSDFEDLQEVEVPIEMQVKTKPMQIAQDSVHDTVYKKDTLPKEIRNQLSEILFPVVEGMAQINGFIDKDETKQSGELKQEVNALLKENIQILKQYADILNEVNKRYKLVTKEDVQQKTLLDELDLIQETIMQKNNSDMISEMHDQKSPQFFKDIESGKYNVPSPYVSKDSNLEQDDSSNIEQQTNTALVEYKPNRLKMFFDNIVNRIKSSNIYKTVMNTGKNENTDSESIDRATEKIEMQKKSFEDSLIVSKEEQEKNRKEYEQSKQKSASLSVTKGKEQEGDERN